MSDFSLHDAFKTDLPRPNHPDFWKLSLIVLDLDASMTEGRQRGESVDEVLAKKLLEIGDPNSITYMATQRAFHIHGVATVGDLIAKKDEVIKTSMSYLEGVIVGARFGKAS